MDGKVLYESIMRHKSEILEPYDEIMKISGYEGLKAFFDYFEGCTVYVPMFESLFKRCIEMDIKREFKGDYYSLARKYGVTERSVRYLVKKKVR